MSLSTGPSLIRIYGAGIAGACLARSCKIRGLNVEVVDPNGMGTGASGNPSAVVEPRLIVSGSPEADFRIASFLFALDFYARLEEEFSTSIWQMRGVRQFASMAYSQKRLNKIAEGVPTPYPDWFDKDGDNLLFPSGGSVDTQAILKACFERVHILTQPTASDAIEIFATGPELLPQAHSHDLLPIIPNRGVVSYFPKQHLSEVLCGAGYAIEDQDFMYCGANYQRWIDAEDQSWKSILSADHEHNKVQAEELLATSLETPVKGRVSLRSTTPDRMPLAGLCTNPDQSHDKYMCIGFGSRGFTYAPVVADQLISIIAQKKGPLSDSLWGLMSPSRFNSRIVDGQY